MATDVIALLRWQAGEKRDGRLKAFLRKALSPSQASRISRARNRLHQFKAVRSWRKNARFSNRRFYIPVKRWNVPSREEWGH